MATNTNGHLVDSAGNVAVDFVWGNFPMQPNDVRAENGGSLLDYTLDSHNIVEDGWNGYPGYTPNTAGGQTAGVDYITVPNVLGSVATDAATLLGDLELNTTIATAATNAAKTVTAAARASGGLAVLTASGAGAAYAIGTKVTIASVDATVNGTYTVVDNGTNTFTVATPTTTTLSLTGLSGTVVGVAGTVKAQSIAAGQKRAAGTAMNVTPWAAAS